MAKPEWGRKHFCTECDAKFYDMKRIPVTCPACSAKVEISKSPIVDRAAQVKPKPKSNNTPDVNTEDLIAADTTDENILEDTVEIDEEEKEEDDMAEVLEVDIAKGD